MRLKEVLRAECHIVSAKELARKERKCRSASFATPAHVRKEWAEEHGLTAFQSPEYDAALEAISRRLGVTTGKAHCKTLRVGAAMYVRLYH